MIDSFLILSYLIAHPLGNPHAHKIMKLESPAFMNHHSIPLQHTCYGSGQPIPVQWHNPPKGTQSLVLIMTDQDMPRQKKFYHWAVFNIPPSTNQLNSHAQLSSNSWHHKNYQPPCPRYGVHHYQIRLYALNTTLTKEATQNPVRLRKQMLHHILDTADLVGQVKAR